MATQRRDESPSGLSDIVEPDGLLGIGLTVRFFSFSLLPSVSAFVYDFRGTGMVNSVC
jgi:hypothetical protein